MTSAYLDTPPRSLEQLRDELRERISEAWEAFCRSGTMRQAEIVTRWRVRLAAVEAAIAERNRPAD